MSDKKYSEEIRRFEASAEDKYDDYDDHDGYDDYDDYDDFDEDHFDNGLEGNYDEDHYEEVQYVGGEDSYEESYDNYSQESIGRIDPNDRTLTISVSNKGNGAAFSQVILFGANEGAPQVDGVTVIVQESSHNEVREESKANPFKIQGMKMSVSDPQQFDNVWSIVRRSATGSEITHRYQPRNATSPQNTTPNLIDDSSFEMDVTGQDSIRFNLNAGGQVTITVTIKARVDMGNVLGGRNVAEMATAPRPTGLPQIDLMRQGQHQVFGMCPRPRRTVRRIVRRPVKRVSNVVANVAHALPHPPLPRLHKRRRHLRKRRPNQ